MNARFKIPTAPAWQRLEIGMRVRSIGRRKVSKTGTVMCVVPPAGPWDVPRHVLVRWDRGAKVPRPWATDCLVVVDEKGETA